jgi:DUF4097 and DUF4098 domain-containing protein YvlB
VLLLNEDPKSLEPAAGKTYFDLLNRPRRLVSAMRRHVAAALATIMLLPLAACSGSSEEETSYQVDQPVTALVVDARAAAVTIEAGSGPVSVTERYRYSDTKPSTAHTVDGQTLRLTESGCGNDKARCETEFRIRMPSGSSAQVTARAGAVKVNGLGGDVHVTTQAGAVDGTALSGETVVVQTQAGAMTLEFAKAPATVQATTELGAVTIRLPQNTAYAVNMQTDVGSSTVSVRQDAGSPHKISVKTHVGAVTVEPAG